MKAIFVVIALMVHLFAYDATIEVSKNLEHRSKIAIFDQSGARTQISKQIYDMLVADFKTTGHFLVDEGYMANAQSTDSKYREYDYLIRYSVRETNRLNVDVDIYRASNNQIMHRASFFVSSATRYPFLAHSVVSSINDFFGYPSVEWMTSYVIFSKTIDMGKSDIFISDYTLTYQQSVVSGGINVFPKWADEKKEAFYYTSLNEALPTLYRVNLYSGERVKILENEGVLICSDTRNGGKELLLTLAYNDQPEIYLYNVETKRKKRLTYFSGIDVNGQFLGNDEIVFVSDRLGYPNIYRKKIGESDVNQVVFHGRNNHSVTANGDYMVYVSRDSGNVFARNSFNLYLISTQTSYIRPLTATGINQFPKFSSTGDTVLFIKNYDNESALGIIRINQNRSYLFPLKGQKIQSIDW